jgi:hypothetical protein
MSTKQEREAMRQQSAHVKEWADNMVAHERIGTYFHEQVVLLDKNFLALLDEVEKLRKENESLEEEIKGLDAMMKALGEP